MTTNAPRPEVLRYTAFSSAPDGGNPAGVVLDATALDDGDMLAIAADLGYSESAFLTAPPEGLGGQEGWAYGIRYFSPKAEVPFCGHATIATAVALAERMGPGELVFATRAGIVPVEVAEERPPPRTRGGDSHAPGGPRVRLRTPRSPDAPLGPDDGPVGVAGVGHRLPCP